MTATLTGIAGGIGLFLLGMILMTDALKTLAGDALRRLLARFTGNRLSAVTTGAAVTLLVQSSSATTLATIGFVSAGLLGFQNSIGVIIGANLGTTSTGWIVSLLGLKFSMGTVALPLVGAGALMRLLARGQLAHVGLALAGFGLIFVGIDALQAGMSGFAERFDLAAYARPGLGSRLLLVGIGVVMTIVMQSSSAAVATTLTAVASGAIGTEQAAALVIGQNIGTTFTAIIAAIGASVPAKRTALVHVAFNVSTGLIAFLLLPWIVAGLEALTGNGGSGADNAVTIAAFHTAFSLLGALLFVPLMPQFAAFITRLLPERRSALTRHLDPSLREVPALAIAAAGATLRGVSAQVFAAAGRGLIAGEKIPSNALAPWREATEAAGKLVERLSSVEANDLERLTRTLHLLDHVRQFVRVAGKTAHYSAVDILPTLRERADTLGHALIDCATPLSAGEAVKIDGIPATPMEVGGGMRASIMAASAAGSIEVENALAALSAQRWMEQLSHHGRRILNYAGQLDDRPAEIAVADPVSQENIPAGGSPTE